MTLKQSSHTQRNVSLLISNKQSNGAHLTTVEHIRQISCNWWEKGHENLPINAVSWFWGFHPEQSPTARMDAGCKTGCHSFIHSFNIYTIPTIHVLYMLHQTLSWAVWENKGDCDPPLTLRQSNPAGDIQTQNYNTIQYGSEIICVTRVLMR